MKRFDIARYNANTRASDFMNDHDAELSGIDMYVQEKAAFLDAMAKLEAALQYQAKEVRGIVHEKARRKLAMAECIHKFALRASVQAQLLGMHDLEKGLTWPLSDISYCDGVLSVTLAESQKELMKKNMDVLTVIAAADIIEMEASIKAFNDTLIQPKDQIKLRKAHGHDSIPVYLKEISLHRNNIGKIVHSFLSAKASEWDVRTRVGKPHGIRHLSVAIYFCSAKSRIRLKNVKCTLTDGKETIVHKSTRRGWVRFYSLPGGNWTATCELPGYETQTLYNIGAQEGKVTWLEVKFRKGE
jgi:hypothetical protein